MNHSNSNELFNESLSFIGVQKDEQNLNDSNDLLDNYGEVSSEENEMSDVDIILTDVIDKHVDRNEVDVLSDVTINRVHDTQLTKGNSAAKQTTHKPKRSKKEKRRYLSSWESEPVCFYKTYYYDMHKVMLERKVCWLYKKSDENGNDRLYCNLCAKYPGTTATNRKRNPWRTDGYSILKLAKIKEHAATNTHKQAEQLELKISSKSQPNWLVAQNKERSKHELAVHNLILSSIYLCQQDQAINSFEKLCILIEALGVKLLPAELGGVSYRNDNAAIEFLRYVSACLHEELVQKINQSPSIGIKDYLKLPNIYFLGVLGWMLDESTSRTVEKSLIIYVRYFENNEAKTEFYGILKLNGDGTAHNIVESIKLIWQQDGLNPEKTCWFSTDNAATFTGTNYSLK